MSQTTQVFKVQLLDYVEKTNKAGMMLCISTNDNGKESYFQCKQKPEYKTLKRVENQISQITRKEEVAKRLKAKLESRKAQ